MTLRKEGKHMERIIRITNYQTLKSASPGDHTSRLGQATHAYFYFAEYLLPDTGIWEEGRSWAGAVSVGKLFHTMRGAGLLREVTATKQSGGQ
jgi:hypothetical protein